MSTARSSVHVSYVAGEAWCLVTRDVVIVFERELGAAKALDIRSSLLAASLDSDDGVTTEAVIERVAEYPQALAVLSRAGDSWSLARRRGVPARSLNAGELGQHFGPEWGVDAVTAGDEIAFGAIASIDAPALPIDGGIVRVSAVLAVTAAPAMPLTGDANAQRTAISSPTATPDSLAESRSVQQSEPGIGHLIDSVPGFIRPAADLAEQSAASAQAQDEPSRPVDTAAPEQTHELGDGGDHDGMTVNVAEAQRLLGNGPAVTQAADPIVDGNAPATGPMVLSTLCPNGHVNPSGSTRCAACGATISPASSGQRPRPEFAVIVVPNGERVPLGRGVVLGRRPRTRRIEDTRVPRLIAVDSPNEDVSRTHLEVRLDDWNIVAIDLGSTNGTVLLRAGIAPQRLRPEAAMIAQFGDRFDLGDGVVVRIEPFTDADASELP